ncbi:hypothetical protein PQO03_19100 [Lentisphaera profundi]|uniref:Phosphagen kinase C-terminal domain-containing protein n=1 Tax=Lentisphaera profundi TaxID=1658616 RepID=A0ABY7VV43_9BACT|nr:hypothetical protein [Lentisphaera profundi]WDE97937.1 hypothetical protein PQO03_19100 [Lentisphaera profundi]
MINTTDHEPLCPKCESSAKKITLSHQAFCPSCFHRFSDLLKKLSAPHSPRDYHKLNPRRLAELISAEQYELAEELCDQNKIKLQQHGFLSYTLEFHRNLENFTFLNKENLKLPFALVNALSVAHPDLKVRDHLATKKSFIYIDDNEYTKFLTNHHITYGLTDHSEDTTKIEDFRLKIQQIEKQTAFAFQDEFGFLGPELNRLGQAFNFNVTLALPHLYFDQQIPKLQRACQEIGFTLSPTHPDKTTPLLYTIENNSSSCTSLSETLESAIELSQVINAAENQAQFNSLEKTSTPYKYFSSAYWSLGSSPSLSKREYKHSIEDLFCASLFDYTDNIDHDKLSKIFHASLYDKSTSEIKSEQNQDTDIAADTFEQLLNTIRT